MGSLKQQRESSSQLVKELAKKHGFDSCGISKAAQLEEEAVDLEKWLKQGLNGEMDYMSNHFDKRIDPRELHPGTKSVVSLTLNYYPKEFQREDAPQISKYAYGRDYHKVIRKKLKHLLLDINEAIGEVAGRGFVDSAPIMDKAWAKRSGLGWQGKHTNIISKGTGSFFFLAELLLDIELEPNQPIADFCGTCTKCIDACPTDAILGPYEIDSKKCISYLTIELKDEIPTHFKGKMDNWMFGCDVCQDVCPWNRFSKPHTTPDFDDKTGKLKLSKEEWYDLDGEKFEKHFLGSAVNRTKFQGLHRNLEFLED